MPELSLEDAFLPPRPTSEDVRACRPELDKRPDAGGRDSCGTTAPSSPPWGRYHVRPLRIWVRQALPLPRPSAEGLWWLLDVTPHATGSKIDQGRPEILSPRAPRNIWEPLPARSFQRSPGHLQSPHDELYARGARRQRGSSCGAIHSALEQWPAQRRGSAHRVGRVGWASSVHPPSHPQGVSAGRGGSSGPLPLRTIDGVERL